MSSQADLTISLATSAIEIEQCFPVMSQLRLHLERQRFVRQVQFQIAAGCQLAYLKNSQVVAVAGFRIATCSAWVKYLSIEDLVIDEKKRSQTYGQTMFTWLIEYAKYNNCQQLHLDSEVKSMRCKSLHSRI